MLCGWEVEKCGRFMSHEITKSASRGLDEPASFISFRSKWYQPNAEHARRKRIKFSDIAVEALPDWRRLLPHIHVANAKSTPSGCFSFLRIPCTTH